MTPSDQTELRNKLKDKMIILLKDYLRDNLENWSIKPTPERIEEYLRFHMPGWTTEEFAGLFDSYVAAAEQRAVIKELKTNWISFSGKTDLDYAIKDRIAELEQSLRKEQG